MSSRKNLLVTSGLALSASLIAAMIAVLLVSRHYARTSFDLLCAVCGEAAERNPETREDIAAALKEYTEGDSGSALLIRRVPFPAETSERGNDLLSQLGYHASDFVNPIDRQSAFFAAVGLFAALVLFFFTFICRNRMETRRIRSLTDYLEQVNSGKAAILSASGEDDFSRLEDEIYKTVTFLSQTKEQAVQAKNDFAENLSNIAHQIKTPITAMSLSVQRMKQDCAGNPKECPKSCHDEAAPEQEPEHLPHLGQRRIQLSHLAQLELQLSRLTHLEESLLLLSRLDAGTLLLQKEEADVFTLLVLAADNLQELFADSGTSIEIPELGEMPVAVDMEWTMEALINLMKNCMEHNKGGTVHCSYAQNPLYTELLIWDEGPGFPGEDLPHLFERFYRGKNAGAGGIGIGLALAKEIIERQNGTIRARNRQEGGAIFEIHFY